MRRWDYREFLKLHDVLTSDIEHAFDLYSLEMKSMELLFELFCFFVVKKILEKTLNCSAVRNEILEDDGRDGRSLSVSSFSLHYGAGGSVLRLFYQKTYISYSGRQFRPDISIETPEHIYLFDAKYRGEAAASEIYQTLHCYRDAIVHNGKKVRGVFGLVPESWGNADAVFDSEGNSYDSADIGNLYGAGAHAVGTASVAVLGNNPFLENLISRILKG